MMSSNTSYAIVELGSNIAPLPVYDVLDGATRILASSTSALSFYTLHRALSRSGAKEPTGPDDTISVQERIYAELMRSLPTRSMLPHLLHELVERDPTRLDWDQRSFICRYVGPPSIGKSFMIKSLGKLTHPKGVLNVNCKDIDLGVLFVETVFDTSAANKEKAAIDAKLLQGNANPRLGLKPESLDMLRHALGRAYVEEERDTHPLIAIDWNGIEVKGENPEQQHYQLQVIREAINQVCEIEGIKISAKAGEIGITTRDGVAIRAADPKSADYGRPILLDEFMRCKPGTAQKLYEYIAMLSDPRVDRFEVMGGHNRPFTFYRKDLPKTYRVNMTDNPAVNGMGSMAPDSPLVSRLGAELDTRTVPDPAMCDYADRIGQALTNVPLLQIYYSAKEFFDNDPKKLVEIAKEYRTRGLTKAQILRIPNEEILNIERAPKTIAFAEQLGSFFEGLKPLFNPDAQSLNGFSTSAEYADYLQNIEIDLRLVTKLMEKASVVLPEITDGSSSSYVSAFQAPSLIGVESFEEEKLETRGTRLETYVLSWLHQIMVPADRGLRGIKLDETQKLYQATLKHAANNGIGDPSLREAGKGDVSRINELYDLKMGENTSHKYRLIRDAIVGRARRDYELSRNKDESLPELPVNNDDIFSLQEIELALEHAQKFEILNIPEHCAALPVPAITLDELAAHAVGMGIVVDSTAIPSTDVFKVSDLASRDAILISLATDLLKSKTLDAIWNPNLKSISSIEPSDKTLDFAAGISPTGFAVSTVLVQSQGKSTPLHFLRMPEQRYLIITDKVDRSVARLLRGTNISFIDRSDLGAAAMIDENVREVAKNLGGGFDSLIGQLRDSFLIRNGDPKDEVDNRQQTLGHLMVNPNVAPIVPLLAFKRFSQEQLMSLTT